MRIGAVLILLLMSGCGWLPFVRPGGEPEKKWTHIETLDIEPRFVVIEGKVYPVVDQIHATYQVGAEQKEPKIPGWKKVWQAIWGWGGILAVLGVGLGFLGVPVLPILFMMVRRIRSSNRHLHQIVASVDDGLAVLPPDQQAKFKGELAKTQDSDTKKVVVQLKGDIV